MAEGNGSGSGTTAPDFDVVVVGAGFAGMYLIHRLRSLGLSVQVFEEADDVGGTWYWNRYPGARCDIQSINYSYSFDAELDEEWQWDERYATQPEILRYANHVAERFDLRRNIRFGTRIDKARWNEDQSAWQVTTKDGETVSCRHYVMATGCLSLPKPPEINGFESFGGEVYFTGRWPHEEVDFTGKKVGVIGTGSSAIQSIPLIAAQADSLTIFQRTPNYCVPAHNGPVSAKDMAEVEADRADFRERARWSAGGVPIERATEGALTIGEADRNERMEAGWGEGTLFSLLGLFNDVLINPDANEVVAEFLRTKIRSIVDDPEVAEMLCPTDFPVGTKRLCLGTNYYETFNRVNVSLVNLRKTPIAAITETGIETQTETGTETFDFDVLVFATGFDAMTGALVSVDIEGRDGATLKDGWLDGPVTYLGLTVVGFPNFFTVTGPGSPSVLSNMMVSIEQHVDWICQTIADLRAEDFAEIEPTDAAHAGWVQHVNDAANITLFPQANSWYMGANVPGKPQVFLPYIGGVDTYRQICNEVVEQEYLGFARSRQGADGEVVVNDGIIRRMQFDVSMMLQMMGEMELPPLESMSPEDAREFMAASSAMRAPGPDVGEIVDGEYPAADGPLRYRLYRPDTPGPHPLTVYFHGGGWVLGSEESDDPLCRDLCVRSGSMILSVDYRHAPEHPFPAAPDDAWAAVRWAAENAESLGAMPGPMVLAGWSAGANLAAVTCQTARDNGGPAIAGQVLITPVTDSDFDRPSYTENAEGYVLTRGLMEWFWSHYDVADKTDPRVAPLRAADLSGLPPAFIMTADFDPLRDEGIAYVEALNAAGVDAKHLRARGHIHTSVGAVDMIISGATLRDELAEAIAGFFPATVGSS